MDKEVSHAVELAVTMTVLAVVLGIIFYLVSVGGELREDVYATTTDINVTMQNSTLEELCDNYFTEMTAASAYNIIMQNSAYISKYTCYYCYYKTKNNVYRTGYSLQDKDNICLKNHLKGKIHLIVYKNGAGKYHVSVHSIVCPKSRSTTRCSCSNYPHESACPQASGNSYCTCTYYPHGSSCFCYKREYDGCSPTCWCESKSSYWAYIE